ncbi:MAG: hypothetical protein K8T26_04555 [Lentisphaerae bacterium]|nr:hypothetical protein [Lentisphaerota bacterium]
MPHADITLTVVDFEGTGSVEGHPDEPWQIGLVRMREGRVVPEESFTSLLRVGDRPFSRHAPGRHGELRKEIARAPRLPDLWPTLRPWLAGRPLAAHNTATEKRYLKGAFPLHALGPWVDTLKLIRLAQPAFASHKLEDLTRSMRLQDRVCALLPNRAPHDALFDAMCSAMLLEQLLEEPGWRETTIAALAAARPAPFHRLVARRRGRQRPSASR